MTGHRILTVDYVLGKSNSPAGKNWVLLLKYATLDEIVEIPITYGASGEIDAPRTCSKNLSIANSVLQPAIEPLRLLAALQGHEFDFWEFANWLFVGFYWTMLANVGQLQPVNYTPMPVSPLPRLNTVNLSDITVYDYKYNWFVNQTLYRRYSTYLTTTILPMLGHSSPQIADLSDNNSLQLYTMTFVRSYICQIRDWKHPIEAFISVAVTIYVFVTGFYTFIKFFVGLYIARPKINAGDPRQN